MSLALTLDSSLNSRRASAPTPLRSLASVAELEAELLRHLTRSRRQGDPIALLWVEIDVLGGHLHDTLAQALSARLQNRVRRTDFVFQVGRAAYAVLLETDKPGAQLVQTRLMEQLRGPYGMDIGLVQVHVSIGLSVPSEAIRQGSSLLQCAQDDMYVVGRAPSPAISASA